MSRPEIKFSETNGEDVKSALENYRDTNDFSSFEEAVRALLPAWTFEDSSDTLVIGDEDLLGINTQVTKVTDRHIEFEDAPTLTLPDTNWEQLRIDVSELSEQERRNFEWYFDVEYLDDDWAPVTVDLGSASSLIYGWLPDATAATLGGVQTLSIPRSRIESQLRVLKQSIGRDVLENTAENISEPVIDLEKQFAQLKPKSGTEQSRSNSSQIMDLTEQLRDELPEWMVEANKAQHQLLRLSIAVSAIRDDKIIFE